jgi:hypothetical protein
VETGAIAEECATDLNATIAATLDTPADWIAAIEASPGPLVRYAPWPNGARSALCVSGDLDALSLLDYASRLWVR